MSQTSSQCSAGIDFRMVFGALRHAVQRIDFRQYRAQRVGLAQGAQESAGRGGAQRLRQFLPDPLRHQRGQLAAVGHLPHQRQRFRGDGETQRREARHEAGRAQHPQRILDEGVADVAQHARFDVARAAERIDQRAVVARARSR